jgi:hypothetical protein
LHGVAPFSDVCLETNILLKGAAPSSFWLRLCRAVFIVLEHGHRRVLHFNVTEHPTAAWTSQQIVEAFLDRDAPRYLIGDRDNIYGDDVRRRISSMGIEELRFHCELVNWQSC